MLHISERLRLVSLLCPRFKLYRELVPPRYLFIQRYPLEFENVKIR